MSTRLAIAECAALLAALAAAFVLGLVAGSWWTYADMAKRVWGVSSP